MKLKHTTKVPVAGDDLLQVVAISIENVKAAKEFVKDQLGLVLKVGKEQADKGFQTLHLDGKRNVMLIGIGEPANVAEELRRAMHTAVGFANDHLLEKIVAAYPEGGSADQGHYVAAMAEALFLSNYQFLTYKTKKEVNTLKEGLVWSPNGKDAARVTAAAKVAAGTAEARDLVNEPVITLTAPELANRCEALGKKYGFAVEVLHEKKIRSLKMGGLLAVNSGSIDPPTFSILEWKPANAKNKRPVVLVGKGVVYDTGGLSLKPTQNSMDFMKSDMAGAAAVIGTMCAVSALELPVHVVGLVPASDNRPGQKAYTPGDVITMFDGTTVEVLNTDAEGRLLLADALAYAKKYDPALVIDLATLTGAQVVTLGYQGSALMATAGASEKDALEKAGERVHERVVELPLWEEYREQLKSDIADMKNIGGKPAGSITAGKFLQHFTDYPWIHLDIAGPAFLQSADSYRGKNGTGVGVRLLTEFIGNHFA